MTTAITDLDDFKALDPFFRIIELARLGDGGLVHLSRPPSSPARSRVAPDGCARRHAVSAYLAGWCRPTSEAIGSFFL
jgi:hypothetical protein